MAVFHFSEIENLPLLAKFGKNINEALIIDVFPNLNGVYEHNTVKNTEFKVYSNSSKTIGISNKNVGILKSIEAGIQVFVVKGKPTSKANLVKWLEL